ncbi:hypothetical protein MKX03_035840 [Papaver bracteatum]|nr:hypothetical protein MKX03_035840 [Papaver bracteatum]
MRSRPNSQSWDREDSWVSEKDKDEGQKEDKIKIVRHQFLSNLFNCGALTKLKLKVDIEIYSKEAEDYCKDYFSKIALPKSMDLHYNANNLFLRSNCPPLLEYFSIKGCKVSIDNCSDMDWFDIESLTLKYLELTNCIMPKKIKLNVPNLKTFVCKDYTWREYSMVNISSLVCAHVEMLDFRSQGEEEHYYLKLPMLEKELGATRAMDFLKSLDIVNELQLSPGILEGSCWWYQHPNKDWEVTFSCQCILSQLKSVKIIGLGGFDCEFNLVEFLLKNASNLKEAVLYKIYGNNHEHYRRIDKFRSKLLACPRSSSNIAVFLL